MEPQLILASGNEPNQEIDLRRAWQTIARSAWIIVICVGLATAAAMLAVRRFEPVYSASATVRIEEKQASGMNAFFSTDYANVLATATQILTSRKLAYDVVDSLAMRLSLYQPVRRPKSEVVRSAQISAEAPSQAYRFDRAARGMREVRVLPSEKLLGTFPDSAQIPIEGGWVLLSAGAAKYDRLVFTVFPRNDVASALRDAIRVAQAGRDANVLRITYSGKDPAETMQVPNVLARAYVQRRLDLSTSQARSTVTYLQRQVGVVGEQLNEQESGIRDYLLSKGVSSVDGKIQDLVSEMNLVRNNMISVTLQRDAVARALVPLSQGQGVDGAEEFLRRAMATPEFLEVASTDLSNLSDLNRQREALLQRRSKDDPDVVSLVNQMNQIKQRIQDRAAAFLSQRNSLVTDRQHRVDSLQRELSHMPEQAMEFQRLERDRLVLQETMRLVQGRLKEAEISASVPDSSAQLLDDAVSADQQANSSQTLIFAVAIFSGLIVGVGVAFLRDWLDTTIHDEADLRAIVGVPVVGIIPNLQQQSRAGAYRLPTARPGQPAAGAAASDAEGGGSAPGSVREYHTPAAEAYRTLRTNLNYLTPPRPPRVIVVTSALPGDGKTTTVVNLAITLAQQGQRVILIDAETRRGTVHEAFGIPPSPGFFDLMYGQASPGECIRRVTMETGGTVDVLPLGSSPSVNPADLLVSTRLQPLFDRLRQQYDYVLLDTPPLNLFTDAALIAANADALLLVARSDKTDRDELKFAVAQLHNVQVNLAGAILNDVELRRGSRYRQGYGYYYEYGR